MSFNGTCAERWGSGARSLPLNLVEDNYVTMNQHDLFKLGHIEKNRDEYGDDYQKLSFLSDEYAQELLSVRQTLLDDLSSTAQFGYKNTKVDVTKISPGCRLCAEGLWSCLFINGCCNAACFYCPSRQDNEGLPSTNTVEFSRAEDYVAYIEEFGFTGVSLSGGEPLLTFEKSLDYLTAVKKRFGDRIYFWMYTNGLLFTPDKGARLRDAGLDEIRFDIGATGYRLDFLKQAVGVIPTITVEIPALPDKQETMKRLLPQLVETGVNYLNLHQLRLTPHNFKHLTKRDYRFSHGEKVTVPASELAALELVRFSRAEKIDLPINYCSFVYKNRFQGAGARRRAARSVIKPYESITENGYIRTMAITVNHADKEKIVHDLSSAQLTRWHFDESSARLFLKDDVLASLPIGDVVVSVSYAEASMRQHLSYRYPFKKVELSTGREINIERWAVAKDVPVSRENILALWQKQCSETDINTHENLFTLNRYEFIPSELGDYF